MEPVYVKRFINSEDDFPQKDGNYICHHYGMPDTILDVFPFKVKESHWFVEVDWYMEPVEMPTEEEQIIYFNNHSAAIEIKPSGLKLPLMTRSEVLKFANWLLSRLK